MNNIIGSSYVTGSYSYAKGMQAQREGDSDSFLDVARRIAAGSMTAGYAGGYTGVVGAGYGLYNTMAVGAAGQAQTTAVAETQNVSLESMLKAKYPRLAYNVGDASSSYWRTRNDYPHELLFQEGDHVAKTLENWKPSGANPQFSWYRGPLCSKAVIVHPKAQERMDSDPEFAKEVMARIEAWWAYDIARNEAICPGFTTTTSQAVAIGEDGSIVNALAGGGSDPQLDGASKNRDDEYDWWEERLARHAMFMQLWIEGRIEDDLLMRMLLARSSGSGTGSAGAAMSVGDTFAMQAAEQTLSSMMQGDSLKNILGDTIAGTSTEAMLANTWSVIDKGRSLRLALSML